MTRHEINEQDYRPTETGVDGNDDETIRPQDPRLDRYHQTQGNLAFDNEDQYQLYEQQDKLIIHGINLLSNRLNDFFALLKKNGLDLPAPFRKE